LTKARCVSLACLPTVATGLRPVAQPGRAAGRRPRRLRRVSDQAEVAAVPSSETTAAARRTIPVVGMIGAGQLARMTSQAATGLGIGFRVLAAGPADSAALTCQGTQFGDYR